MRYKTIYGLKFYGRMFDLDTKQHFKVTNGRWFERCGYFLLKHADNGEWLILKQVVSKEFEGKEQMNTLPLFTKIALYNFLMCNCNKYKGVQDIINYLTF